jgi:hypothetical protein
MTTATELLTCQGCGAFFLTENCICEFTRTETVETDEHSFTCDCDECRDAAREYEELNSQFERDNRETRWVGRSW